MKLVYDLDGIRENNNGKLPPLPHMQINGYSGGFALMLSDGEHDGICFPGYETKAEAIEAAQDSPAIPEGWHVYILHANGADSRNPSHIYWGVRCEYIA